MKNIFTFTGLVVCILCSWSSYAQQINHAEYFIDTDPGFGNGTAITVSSAADSVDLTGSINLTGLSEGFHNLFIRMQYTNGTWSLYEPRKFYINPPVVASTQIAKAEYFIDTDPGFGNGTIIPVSLAADSVDLINNINLTGLSEGFHNLFIRMQYTNGIWSLYEPRKFYINAPVVTSSQIVKAESFFDTDPGPGNGTPVSPSFPSADSVDLLRNISTFGLNTGSHYLYVRVQNQLGIWSVSKGASFSSTCLNAIPAKPVAITATGGNTKVCPGDSKVYSISPVDLASSYIWNAPVGGVVTSGQGTTSVTVNFNSGFLVSDTISVIAQNGCGNSISRSLIIKINSIPATPGIVTGTAYGLCGATGVAYSVTNVAGVIYNWTVPTGVTIASGQSSNAITANFPATNISGYVIVTASNGCGSSAQRRLTVKTTPATPATISGPTTVCSNSTGNAYSIAAIPTATSYKWVGPTGSHISDGVVTSAGSSLTTTQTSVTVNYGTVTSSSVLTVRAINGCGNGSASTITLVPCGPRMAGEKVKVDVARVYPNPAMSTLTLSFTAKQEEQYLISITDIEGREIFHEHTIAVKGLNEKTIDLNKNENGIYLLKLKSENDVQILKVIKGN